MCQIAIFVSSAMKEGCRPPHRRYFLSEHCISVFGSISQISSCCSSAVFVDVGYMKDRYSLFESKNGEH